MALHFERAEFLSRIERARAALRASDLAALLVFAQESHYYLTGFDTSGFVFFQCAILTADDRPITLLTRRPDLEQARRTSIIEDIRIWYDLEGADPARGRGRAVAGSIRRCFLLPQQFCPRLCTSFDFDIRLIAIVQADQTGRLSSEAIRILGDNRIR